MDPLKFSRLTWKSKLTPEESIECSRYFQNLTQAALEPIEGAYRGRKGYVLMFPLKSVMPLFRVRNHEWNNGEIPNLLNFLRNSGIAAVAVPDWLSNSLRTLMPDVQIFPIPIETNIREIFSDSDHADEYEEGSEGELDDIRVKGCQFQTGVEVYPGFECESEDIDEYIDLGICEDFGEGVGIRGSDMCLDVSLEDSPEVRIQTLITCCQQTWDLRGRSGMLIQIFEILNTDGGAILANKEFRRIFTPKILEFQANIHPDFQEAFQTQISFLLAQHPSLNTELNTDFERSLFSSE